jgi:hypothetical protein
VTKSIVWGWAKTLRPGRAKPSSRYRNHVFAQVKPTSHTRIDFGFALGNMKATGRLIDTGGFAKKDHITHPIPIGQPQEIDDEVRHWLERAHEMDT